MPPLARLGAEAPSAGGAPIDQIIIVSAFTAAVYAGILWVMVRERTGHPTLVGRAAGAVATVDGSHTGRFLKPLLDR